MPAPERTQKHLADVELICAEIKRFSSMSWEELKAHFAKFPQDGIHSIPRPDRRGSLILGRAGDLAFSRITDRYLRELGVSGLDFDSHAFRKDLKEEFIEWVRQERGINETTLREFLQAAEARNRASHTALTHCIPCSVDFPEQPGEFEVGMVKFQLMKTFLAANEERIRKRAEHREALQVAANTRASAETRNAQAAPDMLFDELKVFFPTFRWVASVSIPKCDSSISKQRAERAVQAALDLLKLFLMARFTAGMRHARRLGRPANRTDLTQDAEGEFHISWSRKSEDAHVEPNWYGMITRQYAPYWQIAVQILQTPAGPSAKGKLAQRFLDGLAWYGDAVSEQSEAGKLVKFVAALERISITQGESSGGNKLSRRAAMQACEGPEESFRKYLAACVNIYAGRSNLMHGALSPLDRRVPKLCADAEHVSRRALLRFLTLARAAPAQGNADEEWLREQFARLDGHFPKV